LQIVGKAIGLGVFAGAIRNTVQMTFGK